jgi:hypothetical protein
MYKITFQNIKTKKIIMMVIDAITGKTVKETKQSVFSKKKKNAKDFSSFSYEKNSLDKVYTSERKTEEKKESIS